MAFLAELVRNAKLDAAGMRQLKAQENRSSVDSLAEWAATKSGVTARDKLAMSFPGVARHVPDLHALPAGGAKVSVSTWFGIPV